MRGATVWKAGVELELVMEAEESSSSSSSEEEPEEESSTPVLPPPKVDALVGKQRNKLGVVISVLFTLPFPTNFEVKGRQGGGWWGDRDWAERRPRRLLRMVVGGGGEGGGEEGEEGGSGRDLMISSTEASGSAETASMVGNS